MFAGSIPAAGAIYITIPWYRHWNKEGAMKAPEYPYLGETITPCTADRVAIILPGKFVFLDNGQEVQRM
jgi:hypothetical protein